MWYSDSFSDRCRRHDGLCGATSRGRPRRAGLLTAALALSLLTSPPALAAEDSSDAEASRSFYRDAVAYIEKGRLKEAVIQLKNALQRNPGLAEARLLLGRTYVRLGDGASAEKELRAALGEGLAEDALIADLGRALLLQGRFADVLDQLDATGRPPETAYDLLLVRADAEAALQRPDAARAALEQAAAIELGDGRAHLGLARLDLAERRLEQAEAGILAALERTPGLSSAIILRAELQQLRGDATGALALFQEALAGEGLALGEEVRARTGRAAVLVTRGRDAEAVPDIERALLLAPGYPRAAYVDALVKARRHDLEAARAALEKANPAIEQFAPAQFLRGILHYEAQELELARVWLRRYVNGNPEHLDARKLLAAVNLKLGAPGDAVETLKPGLEQAPADPQLLMLLGGAMIRDKRFEEGAGLLERAVELAPDDPRALEQLAIGQLARGDAAGAIASLDQSVDLGADTDQVRYLVAYALLRKGDFAKALEVATELRRSAQDSPLAANLQGAALIGLGKWTEAREALSQAQHLDPAFLPARLNLAALELQAGDLVAAEASYRAVLDAESDNAKALVGLLTIAQHRGDDIAAAWSRLARAVRDDADLRRLGLALARDFVSRGAHESALTIVAELERTHRDDAQLLDALGKLQSAAGKHDDAVATFSRLSAVTGGEPAAAMRLAGALFAAGDEPRARAALEQALEQNPDSGELTVALIRLIAQTDGPEAALARADLLGRLENPAWGDQLAGDLLLQAGRVEDAVARYRAAWDKSPTSGLAVARYRAGLRQTEAGDPTAPLRDWLEREPEDDTVRLVLAEGLLGLKRNDEALREYEALKARRPENPTVWNNLAWLYHELGDDRALSHAERAHEIAPGAPAIMDTLAWILLDSGDTGRALPLLEHANAELPENPEVTYHYAVALSQSGEAGRAREVVADLLSQQASFPSLDAAKALLDALSAQ